MVIPRYASAVFMRTSALATCTDWFVSNFIYNAFKYNPVIPIIAKIINVDVSLADSREYFVNLMNVTIPKRLSKNANLRML